MHTGKMTLVFFTLALAATVRAQSINQSVEVNNDFESVMREVRKLGVDMSVPDSLLSFDYNFDYSVFDSPYKGAYEFSPYTIQITPEASRYDGRKLFLRAGAGFFLHPELNAVYAPGMGKNSAGSIYARGGGYVQGDGHDLSGDLGFENRWVLPNSVAEVGGSYRGVFTEDAHGSINYSSIGLNAGIRSLSSGSYFYYDVNFDFRFGDENFFQMGSQKENILRLKGTVGPVIKNQYRVFVDFDLRQVFSSGFHKASSSFVSLYPHLSFLLGPVILNAGARMDYAGDLIFSPAAEASVKVFKKTSTLFAGVTGGLNMKTVYDYKMSNHRFNTYWMFNPGMDEFSGFQFVEREKINFYGGLNGHLGNFFQYAVRGGYSLKGNSPLESISRTVPVYSFVNYGMIYGNAVLSVESERVSLSAGAEIRKTFMPAGAVCFAPAWCVGNLEFSYNWNKRFWAGCSIDLSASRAAMGMEGVGSVPSFVDLGLNAEYKINSRWGAWVKGGNLLGKNIQRVPGYVEKGPYFTLGITLSL